LAKTPRVLSSLFRGPNCLLRGFSPLNFGFIPGG
jgi:hypothetical protein